MGIYDSLIGYSAGNIYPYHMPGHKQRYDGALPGEIYSADITEIDDFDDLHDPSGILLDIEKRAALVYGADDAYMLVNGSTAGVLAGISACVPRGGTILMDRGAHRSAYHAAYLKGFNIRYLYRGKCECEIAGAICADEVGAALGTQSNINAVFITSPTYEGVISDMRGIADICHSHGIPLIVDAAHGAHLGFAEGFAESPVEAGADIVVTSLHKTLPALTQTALLLTNGTLTDRARIRRYLKIYQTSSPSYILMASIDECIGFLEKESAKSSNSPNSFDMLRDRYMAMLDGLRVLKHICVVEGNDIGKLVIYDKQGRLSGKRIYDILLGRYKLQPEMAAKGYCLAMFTVCDGDEAYERMRAALEDIDEHYDELLEGSKPDTSDMSEPLVNILDGAEEIGISDAWEAENISVPLRDAPGRISGEFIGLYPPGTPIVVPGERFTDKAVEEIFRLTEEGLNVQGVYYG